ncbi:MAG: response regulator transcription factor [Chromatiaceae bacterium]|nr:response regulator transcription factor [Chromatiaceae bacterium]
MENGRVVLVVDDDPRICRLLGRYLEQEGYRVLTASSAAEMRQQLAVIQVDLVLLDVRLPDDDGFSLVKELSTVPELAIIMVTGRSDPFDKVLGLELGADDYVTKPFDQRELLARIRSVLRRSRQDSPDAEIRSRGSVAFFAGWKLDMPAQELVSPHGNRVLLTAREFQLLAALVEHAMRVLSRDAILDLLTGRDWMPIDRSIDVLIGKLRKKLGDDAHSPQLIKTVRGVGYKLAVPVERR